MILEIGHSFPNVIWFIFPIAIWVTVVDFLYMRIPNFAIIALLVVFGAIILPELTFNETFTRLGVAALTFGFSLALYMLGVMGAGDVKLLAVTATFIPAEPSTVALWLMTIALSGLPVFFLHAVFSKIFPNNSFRSFSEVGFFPYGPAISIGLMTVVAITDPIGLR